MEEKIVQQAILYLGEEYNQSDYNKLRLFVSDAVEAVCNQRYPFGYNEKNKADAIRKYESVIRQIAIYFYNRQGVEGEVQHSENGTNFSFENAGIPSSYLSSIIPMVKTI